MFACSSHGIDDQRIDNGVLNWAIEYAKHRNENEQMKKQFTTSV
jgi:hypothetical protein